jgi:hypothetical protein
MSVFIRFAIKSYARLLNLYPRRFKDEFAEEMHHVFSNSVVEAAEEGTIAILEVCNREFMGMPFNILKEFWHELHGKELIMLHENGSSSPTTTGQVIMGALPFFLFGLIMIMLELPISLLELDWFSSLGGVLFLTFLILPAIGFGIGWVRNFPRWSYPYIGMALILAFYIQNGSTPGIKLFGIPIFGRELWGWRAWIPLVAAYFIALAVSRSFKPFLRFFTNLWNDWTIPSYLLVGVLPLLVWVLFDEMDRLYTLYFVTALAVLFVGMVILYLRSQTTGRRVLTLTFGVLIIVFAAVWGSTAYWLEHDGIYPSGVRIMWTRAITIILIILIPAWLELLRRYAGRLRTA